MMVKVEIPARYMAMEDPDLMEYVLLSTGLKPRVFLTRNCAAERSLERMVEEEIVLRSPLMRMVLTVES